MKNNRIKAIVALATVTGIVSMTPVVYSKREKSSNLLTPVVSADTKANTEAIDINDLQIQVNNVSISKKSVNSFNNDTSYIPKNIISESTDIATSQTTVTYKIAVSLSSKTGKLYDISKLYLTANPSAEYMVNSKDPKEQEAAKKILDQINIQLGSIKNLNSTSTFTISASFNIESADWNMKVTPNFNIHVSLGGKEEVIPVKAPDIRLTNKYTVSISTEVNSTPDNNDKHVHYLDIRFYNNNSNPNNPGVYNPANTTMKSLTFKVNNPDPTNIEITALDVPGLKINPDGTYTISGDLINKFNKLLKVTTKTDKRLMEKVTVQPINEEFNLNGGVDAKTATSINYYSGDATITQNNIGVGDEITMSQNSNIQGVQSPQVTYGSTISAGLPGQYNIYTGSILTDGNVVVGSGGQCSLGFSDMNNMYVHLDQNSINILTNGTAAQKADLMQKIVNQEVGTTYNINSIQQMYVDGQKIPVLNFTYTQNYYDGAAISTGANYPVMPRGGNNPIIARTITIGTLQTSLTPEQEKSAQEQLSKSGLTSDIIIKNNGKFSGFLLSAPDKYTNKFIDSQGNGYQATDIRYDTYSHDVSSIKTISLQLSKVYVDDLGEGGSSFPQGDSVSEHSQAWLNNSHLFNVFTYGYGSTNFEYYTPNTKIDVNMGAPFNLTSGVTMNGEEIPANDVKVEGSHLIITFPRRVNVIDEEPSFKFHAQYTNPLERTINISAGLVGETGKQGLVYSYNNDPDSSQEVGGASNQIIYNNKLIIAGSESTSCLHSSIIDKNNPNVVTLNDTINNGTNTEKTYMIIGKIPLPGSDNLPGQEGAPSEGGLGTELQSLNNNGVPTWVLPKSALNKENQSILNNPNALELKGKLKYIESPESGWIKYVPGKIDLSNIIAYMSTPTVKAGQNFNMSYNVKFTGENPNVYQIVNSAFKYYDEIDNVASTSNIVTLTPPGENLENTWISGVTTINGELTNEELNKTVDGHSLQELFGHGPDNDGNLNLTPKPLQDKVALATNVDEMKKLGYRLDGIYVNGEKVDANWFNTVGILNNAGITHIKFIVSKIPTYTDTVKVVDNDGKEIIPLVSVIGETGKATGLKEPVIPTGYHIVKITNEDGREVTGVPQTFTDKNQIIIYHIAKDPSTTVSEIYSDGKEVVPSKVTINLPGSKVDTTIPNLPTGYQIIRVTINDTEIPLSQVPIIQSNDNQIIVYTIGKMPTDTVKVVDESGKEIVPSISKTGKTGDETGLTTPNIPKGYHIVKITNENGQNVNGVPKIFGDKDEVTIYHVAKDIIDKVYIDVKTDKGEILIPSHEIASGAPGSKIDIKVPDIPNGYHIDKILLNGKELNKNASGNYNLPTNLPVDETEVNQHIEVIVAKDTSSTTISEIYSSDNKEVVPSKTITGEIGSSVDTKLPKLPKGYRVQKILVNGKVVTQAEVPTVQGNTDNKIVYVIEKIPIYTDKVKVIDSEGKDVIPEVSSTGETGKDTGLKVPKIPRGYHIVKITNGDGQEISGVPKIFTDKDETIIYHVAVNPSTTVTVLRQGFPGVVSTTVTINEIGAKVDTAMPKLPKFLKGYQVVKVTVNDKEVSEADVPTVQSTENQVIVYTIAKMPIDTVKVVDSSGKELVKAISKTGKTGSETGLTTPTIPKGYHVVKITNEKGQEVSGVPKVFGDKNEIIIYHVEKDISDKVYIDMKTSNGEIIVPSHEVASGAPGTKINISLPQVPSGYHIDKVLLNGKELAKNADGTYDLPTRLPSDVTKEINQHIEVIISKNTSTTTIKETYSDNGKEVVPSKTITGDIGSSVDTKIPILPKGYRIEKILVNGKITPESEVPTVQANTDTTIIYVIVKILTYTDRVRVVDSSGKEIVPEVISTGEAGSPTGLSEPKIPAGYHVVRITNGDGPEVTGVPKTFTDKDQIIIYHVVKDPTTTVKEIYIDGKNVVPEIVTMNIVGSKVDTKIPNLPNGYQIIKVTVDGKEIPVDRVPTVQSKSDQIIIYTIGKMPTDTVKVVDSNGQELVPSVSSTGKTGDETGLKTPEIPKGYHVVKITNANGDKVDGIPKVFGDKDTTIIYHVEKDIIDKVYIDIKTDKGIILVPSHEVASGAPGGNIDIKLPKIPKGYHMIKILLNGQELTKNDKGIYILPSKLPSDPTRVINNHIEIIVSRNNAKTVIEEIYSGTNKNVVPSKTITSKIGSKINTKIPVLPSGYRIEKIIVNGKEVSQVQVPTIQEDIDNKIIYVIEKIPKYTDKIIVVDGNGNHIIPPNTTTGEEGKETGLKPPKIPNGYKIVRITDGDGREITELPKNFGNKDNTIIYHVEKVPEDPSKSGGILKKLLPHTGLNITPEQSVKTVGILGVIVASIVAIGVFRKKK